MKHKKVRIELDPKDVDHARNHLATLVLEARTRGDEVLVLDVGKICQKAGLEGEAAHLVFCRILDSDRFVRNHNLWYHHRREAWGTEEAEYTFLLDFGTRRAFLDRPTASPWRILRALLWMAILAFAAMGIWGVLALALR